MTLVDRIKKNLDVGLPGLSALYEMAPMARMEHEAMIETYTAAAVLALIYPKNEEWHMVFIQRASHKKDVHSAQIAFPGGRVEAEDQSMIHAALREANEEVGLDPEEVTILAELTPTKIPVSGFEVFPVLAITEKPPEFVRQESEVEEVIEIPIASIIDPSMKKKMNIKISSGRELQDVPIFNFNNRIIWGATSMILNEVIQILT